MTTGQLILLNTVRVVLLGLFLTLVVRIANKEFQKPLPKESTNHITKQLMFDKCVEVNKTKEKCY